MNTLHTCDDVFESLTAGPIIRGSETAAAIDEHIATCEDCRRLADAFRPATHLIHEAMSVEQRDGLPSYSPEDEFTSRVMAQIEVLPKPRENQSRIRRLSIGLSVVATGLLLLLWSQTTAGNKAIGNTTAALDSLELSESCIEVAQETDMVAGLNGANHDRVYLCCTSCHNSSQASAKLISKNMSQLIAACNSCH